MTVPKYDELMVPVLAALKDGQPKRQAQLRDELALTLGMTEADLAETIPSGAQLFANRIYWASLYLAQAGCLARPARGQVRLAERGRELLAKHPDGVRVPHLRQFAEFRDFESRSRSRPRTATQVATGGADSSNDTSETPSETMQRSIQQQEAALASELLEKIYQEPPTFLERLVLRLLRAMGYGGPAGSVEHTGQSGDGGIDGIIHQDVLGLDNVYVQAKRYAPGNVVGRPDIQSFVGALHGRHADRGIFITTSAFSADAVAYVKTVATRVVLIDGIRLAELMIEYNVGVQAEQTYVIKRVDEDFFETA